MAIEGNIMKFKLNNQDLTLLKSLLEKLNINSMKVNRGKIKLYKHVLAKINEYAEDETEILKASVLINDDGTFNNGLLGRILLQSGRSKKSKTRSIGRDIKLSSLVYDCGRFATLGLFTSRT